MLALFMCYVGLMSLRNKSHLSRDEDERHGV